MHDYLATIHPLVAGESMDYQGDMVTLRGASLAVDPPPKTPVYLGALGTQMLRLAGELAVVIGAHFQDYKIAQHNLQIA